MKQKNDELREFLFEFIPTTLEECKLFTNVFGKNYAQNRLELNLKNVYTQDYRNHNARTV